MITRDFHILLAGDSHREEIRFVLDWCDAAERRFIELRDENESLRCQVASLTAMLAEKESP